ncbi:MAG: UDP-N-acetylmuramoyl-L-alanine--D-glutamate ligase, partial [Planctomycetaceae bacterium]|nr:UDP-N-acetylmuramoyl-L-alanine--D-glutamate ligase [Planctomycetaceae bacterium]
MSFEGSIATHWKNRRVTVMGLGRFGGGIGVTRFLVRHGAVVTLTDQANESDLTDSLNALTPHQPARLVLGRHEERDFEQTDCIVVNPAVKPNHPLLQLARAKGIPLTSEMNLFWQLQQGRIIAVTGSNGKSTTSAMIHAILGETGIRVRLGGNIGQSLLEQVEEIQETDWTVLELSSFQLMALDHLKARPDVAVITNFSPNHLDWHGTLENYRRAKQTLVRYQTPNDVAILNGDDPDVSNWPTSARRLAFGIHNTDGEGVFSVSPSSSLWNVRIGETEEAIDLEKLLSVPGRHNQQNAAA